MAYVHADRSVRGAKAHRWLKGCIPLLGAASLIAIVGASGGDTAGASRAATVAVATPSPNLVVDHTIPVAPRHGQAVRRPAVPGLVAVAATTLSRTPTSVAPAAVSAPPPRMTAP